MVVVRCLILCFKFAKNCRPGSARTRWGSLQRPKPPSWIMGEVRGKGRWKGRKGREGKGKERAGGRRGGRNGKEGEGGGEEYPLQMKILATALV